MVAFLLPLLSLFPSAHALDPQELDQILMPLYSGKSQDGGIARLCKVKLGFDAQENLSIRLEYNSLSQINVRGENGYAVLKELVAPPLGATDTVSLHDRKHKIDIELTIHSRQVSNVIFVGLNRMALKQKNRTLYTCEYLNAQY